MDRTGLAACFLSQEGAAKLDEQPSKAWASSAALCTVSNGHQAWVEELISLSSNLSSPSQPSSPSVPSCSPGGSRSSSEGTGSVYSRSSAVTCLLHSSIKKRSQEAFQVRLRDKSRWEKFSACPSRVSHCRGPPQVEQRGDRKLAIFPAWPEMSGLCQGRGSTETHTSAKSLKLQCLLEEWLKVKLKFSQFLDEVTSNVLDPNSLQAFRRPVPSSSSTTINPAQPEVVPQWSPRPPGSAAQQQDALPEQKKPEEMQRKTYLETDIASVGRDGKPRDLDINGGTPPQLEIDEKKVIPPPPQFCEGFEMTSPFLEFVFPRYPYRSVSLPRGINMVSD